jgi:competence protein ComGC
MDGKRRNFVAERGFAAVTLVTMLVVGSILAVVVVFGVSSLASTATCATNKETVEDAQDAYTASNGTYPANMAALTTGPNALLKSTPTDYTVDGRGNEVAIANNPGGCQ